MLDLPEEKALDKNRLIGGCSRLAMRFDAGRAAAELHDLPATLWQGSGARRGVHRVAAAIFLRGSAPALGALPIEDQPVFLQLPYLRDLLMGLPGRLQRCLLARLPAGAVVRRHIDQAPYFEKTLRIHLPLVTTDAVHMFSRGLCYHMKAGEVWALNNSAVHAVWNASGTEERVHLIADFVPGPRMLELLAAADSRLGVVHGEVCERLRLAEAEVQGA
ncbi:MAG: aspartyl/asparaginyl beta-hydroxylase domain-containing protein [Steroidobacteraceae bacterium]